MGQSLKMCLLSAAQTCWPRYLPEEEDQMAKLEVREGDRILVWLDVTRVAENALEEQVVTVNVPGQRVTATLKSFDVVKHEKGNGWPG